MTDRSAVMTSMRASGMVRRIRAAAAFGARWCGRRRGRSLLVRPAMWRSLRCCRSSRRSTDTSGPPGRRYTWTDHGGDRPGEARRRAEPDGCRGVHSRKTEERLETRDTPPRRAARHSDRRPSGPRRLKVPRRLSAMPTRSNALTPRWENLAWPVVWTGAVRPEAWRRRPGGRDRDRRDAAGRELATPDGTRSMRSPHPNTAVSALHPVAPRTAWAARPLAGTLGSWRRLGESPAEAR